MWIPHLSSVALSACLALAPSSARADPPNEDGTGDVGSTDGGTTDGGSTDGGTTDGGSTDGGSTDSDSLADYRGQFKRGMEHYKAGALAEAVAYWEPIYRELGEQRGYRLAYNLGVAYQELGDATRAAERLQSFLREVDARRGRAESLDPLVEKEEAAARARMTAFVATKGRITVEAASAPRSVQIDGREPRLAGFTAWVTPGDHVVTFAAGTPNMETRTIHVEAGEMVDIAPEPPPAAPPPSPALSAMPMPPPPVEAVRRRLTYHPFPWPLVAVSGGVALAAGIATVPLYANAWTLRSQAGTDLRSFHDARTSAYLVLGGTIGLAAVTAGLATWYFLGTSERDVILTPNVSTGPHEASLGMSGRF
jgi:hypothetical protein